VMSTKEQYCVSLIQRNSIVWASTKRTASLRSNYRRNAIAWAFSEGTALRECFRKERNYIKNNKLIGPLPFMLVISNDVYEGMVLCETYPKE
jgi:hypothetical protein